jgi:hypothetical protein
LEAKDGQVLRTRTQTTLSYSAQKRVGESQYKRILDWKDSMVRLPNYQITKILKSLYEEEYLRKDFTNLGNFGNLVILGNLVKIIVLT